MHSVYITNFHPNLTKIQSICPWAMFIYSPTHFSPLVTDKHTHTHTIEHTQLIQTQVKHNWRRYIRELKMHQICGRAHVSKKHAVANNGRLVLLCFSRVPGFVYQQQFIVFYP
jgi:hypothetical protein